MRGLTVHPRYAVFSILDTLVSNHRESAPSILSGGSGYWPDEAGHYTGLKTMGKDFLAGYLNIADGEKDPRNLLLAFSIDRVLLIEFDISSHVEVGFSTVAIRNCVDLMSCSRSSTLHSAISQLPSDRRRMIPMASRLTNSRRN